MVTVEVLPGVWLCTIGWIANIGSSAKDAMSASIAEYKAL